ncbi:Flp family type IVb pilin [Agrococcus jejuensis]|uniref:Pilus assembly protein Flp/PilA n=1 Tax=Agrococcus jejuensis TaxID=399736 RepID=A0A1G8E9E2_9MICO|nr:Flp family type IVb pilin [Agrococcus jejuensis]SDH66481.1 pilus assembly protein Flp/PilA [Agrococcus jejuensis]
MFAALQAIQGRIADRFSASDRGATAVEYGLLVGLIAVAIITAVFLLGEQLNTMFGEVLTALQGGGAPAGTDG